MTDRPTERDLALDAIDDAFKQAMTQFAKNHAVGADTGGIDHARRSRNEMIAIVESWK